MKNLKELIAVITPNKIKKITLLSDLSEQTKLRQLYEGIHQGKWKNEEEAMLALYGNNDKSRAPFSKLKHDLTHKLMNMFHLVNIVEDEVWEHRRACWECYTAYHTANLLIKLTNANLTAIEILEKIFPKCLKFEFTDLVADIACVLGGDYYQKQADHKKGDYYRTIALEFTQLRTQEIKGQLYLSEVYGYSVNNKGCKPFLPELVQKRYDDLIVLPLQHRTQRLVYFEKTLALMVERAAYHYHEVVRHCEEGIDFFERAAFVTRPYISGFLLKAIECHIYMGQYEEGLAKIQKCEPLLNEGHYNWFRLQELVLKIRLYQKKDQTAWEHYQKIVKLPRFKDMPPHYQETWILHEAFFYIFQLQGSIQAAQYAESDKFRIINYINRMPTLQRDKGGLNFILHVIQIIYLLLKDTPDAAEKCQLRVENLQRYARRYQNDYGAERSRWLIEIINELTLNDFQPKIWQENERIKENKYKLLHTPYDIFDSNYDAEPIPMPRVFDLLEIIVSMPKVYQL